MADPTTKVPVNPNDPGRGPMIMGISWTLTIICVTIVALRIWVRKRIIKHGIASDDWLMVAAAISQLAFQACITVGYTYGLGKRDMNLTFDQLVNILKWMWISSTPAILASTVARISIAVLLIRLFGTHLWLKYFLIIFTTLQTICAILIILFVWLQVDPVQGLWDPLLPASRWNPDIQKITAIVGQSLFTFSDLAYVLFPVAIIWRLNMPMRQKVGLMAVLALSLFTMMASIMKTVTSQSNKLDPNAQYKASVSVLWSAIEQGLVISLGCIPPLRALRRLEIPGWQSLKTTFSTFTGGKSAHSGKSSSTTYTDVELAGKESTQQLTEPAAIHRSDDYEVSYA